MGNRPRNHILEELSLAHLRTVLPASWVIHPVVRDYGTDIQVELFSTDGDRTGIRFYGQVKATDKSVEGDSLQLDRSHIDYWLHHTDPVIIFRYFDSTKCLCWCWVHDIAWRLNPDKETLDVSSFLKYWDQERAPAEIRDHLDVRRSAVSPLIKPYRIAISDAQEGVRRPSSRVAAVLCDCSWLHH